MKKKKVKKDITIDLDKILIILLEKEPMKIGVVRIVGEEWGRGGGGIPDSRWLVITVTKNCVVPTEESTQEDGLEKQDTFLLKGVTLG